MWGTWVSDLHALTQDCRATMYALRIKSAVGGGAGNGCGQHRKRQVAHTRTQTHTLRSSSSDAVPAARYGCRSTTGLKRTFHSTITARAAADARVQSLVQAFRKHGHLAAGTDPLAGMSHGPVYVYHYRCITCLMIVMLRACAGDL